MSLTSAGTSGRVAGGLVTVVADGTVPESAGQDTVPPQLPVLAARRGTPHCSRHTCRTGGGTAGL